MNFGQVPKEVVDKIVSNYEAKRLSEWITIKSYRHNAGKKSLYMNTINTKSIINMQNMCPNTSEGYITIYYSTNDKANVHKKSSPELYEKLYNFMTKN